MLIYPLSITFSDIYRKPLLGRKSCVREKLNLIAALFFNHCLKLKKLVRKRKAKKEMRGEQSRGQVAGQQTIIGQLPT